MHIENTIKLFLNSLNVRLGNDGAVYLEQKCTVYVVRTPKLIKILICMNFFFKRLNKNFFKLACLYRYDIYKVPRRQVIEDYIL